MLFNLLAPLASEVQIFNLFRYLTFRSGGAVLTALLISFLLGPSVIRWLKSKQGEGQPIRMDGPENHLLTKKGTPTMGGVLILLALVISTLLWADLNNRLRVGGAVGDDRLWRGRFRRRLPEADQAQQQRSGRQAQAGAADRHRHHRRFGHFGVSPVELATHLAVPFFKDVLRPARRHSSPHLPSW